MKPSLPVTVVGAAIAASWSWLGCGGPRARTISDVPAPVSRAADSAMVTVPAGAYTFGSTPEERATAYAAYYESAGTDAARDGRWFEREAARSRRDLDGFRIDLTPVTQAAYAEFVADQEHRAPTMDAETWKAQGWIQDFSAEVERYVWRDGEPPSGRGDHPVVLVSWDDAQAYCRWRGGLVGEERALPSAEQFEKAARGERGSVYPWGQSFDPERLNSAVGRPGDTTAVGSFPSGASPYGLLDMAGNVFQWTRTPWTKDGTRYTVKGSAWDDFAGLGRGAAAHGRPRTTRHVIVGFRCAGPAR